MTIVNTEVYEALIDTGATESKAQAAAVSMADYDRRFAKTDADLLILKWMVGFNLAFSVAMIMQHMFM